MGEYDRTPQIIYNASPAIKIYNLIVKFVCEIFLSSLPPPTPGSALASGVVRARADPLSDIQHTVRCVDPSVCAA